MMRLLDGLTIIDLSSRLPGPLAGKLLSDLGAEVIKIEDSKHLDPFLSASLAEIDPSFADWYHELNKNKKIIRLDFNAPYIKEELLIYLERADGIILSLPQKLRDKLGLREVDLHLLKKPLAAIDLKASKSGQQSMHDLNALAELHLLDMHVVDEKKDVLHPPFLPVAGIVFGQQVALELSGLIIKSKKENKYIEKTSYLFETAQNVLGPFYSQNLQQKKQRKFLHNGAFPCYSMYRTKDGYYVAMAAVEEKFWVELSEIFAIPLQAAQRFETTAASFSKVAGVFSKLTSSEIAAKLQGKDLCLSLVRA